jgi:hypothetical protein
MAAMPTIDPRVIGPPPERHAARVVGEMVRWLAGERARLSGELMVAFDRSKSKFGSPIAQRRLADRLRKAGGKALLDLRLRTGKRGNFVLSVVEWYVYDPARHETIFSFDPLREKPWLECSASVWPAKRRDDKFTVTLFSMSHHAMQRLAERCGARAPDDLLAAMRELWSALEREIDWEKAITEVLAGGKSIPLPRPKYILVAGGKAVFEWGEDRGKRALVVTTILDAEMAV